VSRRAYGLERVPFNKAAKQLRAEDNQSGLTELAAGQVFPPVGKGHPAAELRQVLTLAAIKAAGEWWDSGGNCYHKVRKAISTAARNYRGRGGAAAAVAWRGPYDKHNRQYVSGERQTHADAVALADAVGDGDTALDAPAATESDDRDQRDAQRDTLNAFKLERAQEQQAEDKGAKGEANIATGADVVAGGAERTDHQGGHADAERLNPRDDGETAYGVEGATRGLNTGRLVPSGDWIAWQIAITHESQSDAAWFDDVERVGGFDAWVRKNGDRQRARTAHESRYAGIKRSVRDRAARILKAYGEPRLQADWLAAVVAGPGSRTRGDAPGGYTAEPVAPPPSMTGAEPAGRGVVSAAWPREEPTVAPRTQAAPTAARGSHWGPVTVYQDYWQTVTVSGHAWGDHKRNAEAWKREHRRGPALSLLDLVMDGVKLQAREHPQGWGGPLLVMVATRSLLDV